MPQRRSLPSELPFPECLRILIQFRSADAPVYIPNFLAREGYTERIVLDYLSAESEKGPISSRGNYQRPKK